MNANVGTSDKVVRILLAISIAGLYYAGVLTGTLAIVLLVVAAVLALTSFVSFCPLYFLVGMSTCKTKTKKA